MSEFFVGFPFLRVDCCGRDVVAVGEFLVECAVCVQQNEFALVGSERRMCEKRGEVVARAGVNKPGNKCHGGRFVSSHIEIIGAA